MRLPKLLILLLLLTLSGACTEPISNKIISQINSALMYERSGADNERSDAALSVIKPANSRENAMLDIVKMVRSEQLKANYQVQIQPSTEQVLKQADSLASQLGYASLTVWVKSQIGFYYYRHTHLERALPYFLETSKYLAESHTTIELDPVDCLIKNAYFYGNIGDHQLAIQNLEQALLAQHIAEKDTAVIEYSLGYEYLLLNDTIKAKEYFIKAKASAKTYDPIRYAKVLGELAVIEKKTGNMAAAEQLLLEDIALSEQHEDKRNAMFAQIRLSTLYLDMQRWDEAKSLLLKAESFAADKDNLLGFQRDILLLKLQLFESINNHDALLDLYKQLRLVEEQLKYTDGSDAVKNVELILLREQAEWNKKAQETKLQKSNLIGIALLVICTLLLLLAVLLRISKVRTLRLQHAVFESKIATISLAKYKSEDRYAQVQQTIKSYRKFIEERNAAIDHLKEEVSKLESATASIHVAQREKLQDLLSEHLMSEDNWSRFKRVFFAEYREFYDHVIQHLVGITESQLRIVLLQKIGVSNHEMANLLGVGQESIRKAKHRLRKKYGSAYDDCFQIHTNLAAEQYSTQ